MRALKAQGVGARRKLASTSAMAFPESPTVKNLTALVQTQVILSLARTWPVQSNSAGGNQSVHRGGPALFEVFAYCPPCLLSAKRRTLEISGL